MIRFNSNGRHLRKIAAVLAALSVVSLVAIGAIATTNAGGDDVQSKLEELLGKTKDFGVFANTINIENDLDSNFCVDKVTSCNGSFGLTGTNDNNGVFFLNDVTCDSMKALGKEYSGYFILGQNYDIDNETQVVLRNSIGTRISDMDTAKLFYKPGCYNIESCMNYIKSTFRTSKDRVSFGNIGNVVVDEISDTNELCVDVTRYGENGVVPVIIDIEKYNNIANLDIVKKENQIVSVSFKGCEDLDVVSLKKFSVNGVATTNNYNSKICDSIIWNLVDYNGLVQMGEVAGIVVAPDANVELVNNCSGRVIAKSFSNQNGEFHFVSQNVTDYMTSQNLNEYFSETMASRQFSVDMVGSGEVVTAINHSVEATTAPLRTNETAPSTQVTKAYNESVTEKTTVTSKSSSSIETSVARNKEASKEVTQAVTEMTTPAETTKSVEQTTEHIIESPTEQTVLNVTPDEVYATIAVTNSNIYASYINDVYSLMNIKRGDVGVAPVVYDETLTLMACHRAAENAMNDWFVVSDHHMRPNGDVAASVCYLYGQQGDFGEIMGRYQNSPMEIVSGWVASSTHYAAMINEKYTRVGIGVAADSEGNLYWNAIFMN